MWLVSDGVKVRKVATHSQCTKCTAWVESVISAAVKGFIIPFISLDVLSAVIVCADIVDRLNFLLVKNCTVIYCDVS